jgi:cellulose 1,4-beta-cellobiosidase
LRRQARARTAAGDHGQRDDRQESVQGVELLHQPGLRGKCRVHGGRHPEAAAKIRKVEQYPSAVWLDAIARVPRLKGWLDEAKKQQDAKGKPTLTVVVLCNLPNRDCAANASAGELSVEADGEARYRTEFVDPIAEQFAAHPDQPIVAIVEPDSLANMTTNQFVPKCAASTDAYRNSVVYAIKRFALPNVSVYLDAAHAGWLGWDANREKMAKVFRRVLDEAGGPHMIRGFATNVSNFTHLSNRDGAAMALTNPCPNELTYVKMLAETLACTACRAWASSSTPLATAKAAFAAAGAAGAT